MARHGNKKTPPAAPLDTERITCYRTACFVEKPTTCCRPADHSPFIQYGPRSAGNPQRKDETSADRGMRGGKIAVRANRNPMNKRAQPAAVGTASPLVFTRANSCPLGVQWKRFGQACRKSVWSKGGNGAGRLTPRLNGSRINAWHQKTYGPHNGQKAAAN